MEQPENLLSSENEFPASIIEHLPETAMWARFLGIIGFIFSGLFVILALFAGTLISKILNSNPYGNYRTPGSNNVAGAFVTFFYLFLAALGFMMSLFTFRFGQRVKRGLLLRDEQNLSDGLKNLKYLFRSYAIIMIVYLGLISLILIIAFVGMAMRS